MDGYGTSFFARPLMKAACQKQSRSFTVALLASVVEAQEPMIDGHWDKIWPITGRVLKNRNLTIDMRPPARDIIVAYMQLYEKYRKQ